MDWPRVSLAGQSVTGPTCEKTQYILGHGLDPKKSKLNIVAVDSELIKQGIQFLINLLLRNASIEAKHSLFRSSFNAFQLSNP